MYAIIQIGGKQYKIKKGDNINIEKINLPVGKNFFLKNIIMLYHKKKIIFNKKNTSHYKIKAKIIKHIKNKKIKIIKFKRRKHYKKIMGHRQKLTKIKIKSIKIKKNGT